MADFKIAQNLGIVEIVCWEDPRKWPSKIFEEAHQELAKIIASRLCNHLTKIDILAWSPYPKGKFLAALGYLELDR